MSLALPRNETLLSAALGAAVIGNVYTGRRDGHLASDKAVDEVETRGSQTGSRKEYDVRGL